MRLYTNDNREVGGFVKDTRPSVISSSSIFARGSITNVKIMSKLQ
ncbi:hypothetical protein MEG1DRAFT_01925 [Photorhabdus temperata subsp. temperata Meg1]|uniref:Uncharacterized protein n=1 Tax=Photorhabdus temperata subsp. temperata Meg1 TaxID=1393735 RepID=A0A081RXP6_PHOTE|nr:hypothetical protein MEG1DRAFT_01925 [Photorhabdus temperata subsp. temperata Meg1]